MVAAILLNARSKILYSFLRSLHSGPILLPNAFFKIFLITFLGSTFEICRIPLFAADIIIQNDKIEYAIDDRGKNLRFIDKASKTDYLDKKSASYVASIKKDGREFPVSEVTLRGNLLRLEFKTAGLTAELHLDIEKDRFRLEVVNV
jgi:hypothetical protein